MNKSNPDEGPNSNSEHWNRLTESFDRLLSAEDPIAVIAEETDSDLRAALSMLWQNHCLASQEDFLGQNIDFRILPAFQAGQVLVNRFEVESALGSGGMGEVYLAFDRKLGERVALKTMARLLAHSDAIRHRFLNEVQNSRRVTHPNVCRIYDLFEDGGTAFFAMEYLNGESLSHLLERGPLPPAAALELLIQLADGLDCAHRSGVVHGDFKPSNIMVIDGVPRRAVIMDFGLALAFGVNSTTSLSQSTLAGGTRDYMAPELLSGAVPSQRSDIFAFGKVGEMLLPGRKLWKQCVEAEPAKRIASLEKVLQNLRSQSSRRYSITGATLAAASILTYRFTKVSQPAQAIESNARLLVNGFRAAAADLSMARVARGLFVTGVRQSPRVRLVSDTDLFKSLHQVVPGATLPVAGEILHKIVSALRANYWIDAELSKASGRFKLVLTLIRSHDGETVGEFQLADSPVVAPLAKASALWLRQVAGESPQSLALNSPDAESFTSQVPEALQCYYAAMDLYAVGKMEDAIPLLREAIRLDPQFAQAMNVLGSCLNTISQYSEAFQYIDQAHTLSGKLPVRERSWVDADYFASVEDPIERVKAAQINKEFHSDEPRFCRLLARQLCWAGHAEESIAPSRQAVDLAPGRGLFESELIFNLSEAGHFSEAFAEYQRFTAAGVRNPYLDSSAGFALVGLERYTEARPLLSAVSDDDDFFDHHPKILAADIESCIADLEEKLARAEAAQNLVRQVHSHEFLCACHYLIDQPSESDAHLLKMVDLPEIPPFTRQLQCTAWWAHRLDNEKVFAAARSRLKTIADRWPNGFTTAVLKHADALTALRQGDSTQALSLINQSLGGALTFWPLWDLADYHTANHEPDLAEEAWQRFDRMRGTVLKTWSPAPLLLGWLLRAQVARERGDVNLCKQLKHKILDHWSRPYPRVQLVTKAKTINSD